MVFKTTADGTEGIQWEVTLPRTATANTVVRTLVAFATSAGYSEEALVRVMKDICKDYDRGASIDVDFTYKDAV